MYDYNASYLNEQSTLLEEFHKIQRYLIEHPLYQIYQSSADYVAGVNEYYINEVAVREGGTLSVGDVVLFSNVYYGVITEIDEETEMFTIAEGISFRGATGETGPRGGVGPRGLPGNDGNNALEYLGTVIQFEYDGDEFDEALTFNNSDFNRTPTVGDGFLFMYHLNESNLSYIVNGRVTAVGTDTCQVTISPEARQEVTGPTGAQGVQGEMGAEGLSIYLYDGELSSSVASVILSQINIPSGRTLKVGDILFSSLASTYGAMSIVTGTTGTVDFIGTLTGGGGGGITLNKYSYTHYVYLDATANKRLKNILQNAKGRIYFNNYDVSYTTTSYWTIIRKFNFINNAEGSSVQIVMNMFSSSSGTWNQGRIDTYNMSTNTLTTDTLTNNDSQARTTIVVEYWNDTEITE